METEKKGLLGLRIDLRNGPVKVKIRRGKRKQINKNETFFSSFIGLDDPNLKVWLNTQCETSLC